jgi:hypothetical protein
MVLYAAPPLLAFVACTVSGITNFGDGVVFLVGWSFYHLIFDDAMFTLADAMLCIAVLPLASLPALLYAARHEIRSCFAYGCILSLSSAVTTPLGVYLVVSHGSVAVIIIGCLCFVFALVKLAISSYEFGRIRKPLLSGFCSDNAAVDPSENADYLQVNSIEMAAPVGEVEPASNSESTEQVEPTQNLPADGSDRVEPPLDASESVMLIPPVHWSSVDNCLQTSPTLKSWIEFLFPQICEYSIETTICALLVCGLASGFLGGMMGTSAPPQLITFSLLSLTKGAIRSVKVLSTTVANVLRLILLSSSTGLQFSEDWEVYVAVSVASLLGASLGSWLRTDLNKDHLLWCLYWMLWLTGASVIGIFEKKASSVAVAAFSISTVMLMILTLILYIFPRKSRAIVLKMCKC